MQFMDLLMDSSDDELDIMGQMLTEAQILLSTVDGEPPREARTAKQPNIDRSAQEGAQRLEADYFCKNVTYSDIFRRRFRMSKNLFVRITDAVATANIYFVQRMDATGKLGLTGLQKCTAAIRQLAYGTAADAVDEYVRLSESTACKCLMEYCGTVKYPVLRHCCGYF